MSNRRYINAVMSVRRIAPTPTTIKEGTATVASATDKVRDKAARAMRFTVSALAEAAESLGDDDDTIAAGYTDAANKALAAADAFCAAANALTDLSTLYREN